MPIVPSVPAAWNQTNLGNKVVTRTISWQDQVQRAWGVEWNAPDRGVYQFSNGAKRDSTDRTTSGIYGVSGIDYLTVGDGRHNDMTYNGYLLTDAGDRIQLG